MASKLFDIRMADGSRNFADVPQTLGFEDLHEHLCANAEIKITGYVNAPVDLWIDFDFRGHKFSLNNQLGDYWMFVDDPACPDDILLAILTYCEAPA